MTKNPWIKFYPSDWRSDPRLRMCGVAARGLWIEMLCLMHEAIPYGHLLIEGKAPNDTQLAMLAGIPLDQVTNLLGELESAGVFSRSSKGVIYSRRLVRDEKRVRNSQKNGQKGGNPSLCKTKDNLELVNPEDKPEDKPQKPDARSQTNNPNGLLERGSRLPDNWYPDKALIDWAKDKRPDLNIELEIRKFSNYWISKTGKDATKKDWGRTFENWILNERSSNGKSASNSNKKQSGAMQVYRQRFGAGKIAS